MINLCYVIDALGADAGAEKQVAGLAINLSRELFRVHLCSFEDSQRLSELRSCCATHLFPFAALNSPSGIAQLIRFRRFIREHSIDIIHAFNPKACIFAVLGAMHTRCRVVITSRLNTGYWFTPFYLRLYRMLNRRTTRIFANSQAVKRAVIELERAPETQIDVLYNGIDMKAYSDRGNPTIAARLGIPAAVPVVGIVANLRPVKDLDLFLRAARLVSDNVSDAVFLLVGQGPLRRHLAQLAAELNISGRVFFSDSFGSVPDYLARMSIGCLSSHTEGFSNAILEYMAARLPVVAMDVGGNAEAVEDGVTGYLVRRRRPEDLAEPIITLLGDESLRRAMGQRGFERCRALFSMERIIAQHNEYYASLVPAFRPLVGRE